MRENISAAVLCAALATIALAEAVRLVPAPKQVTWGREAPVALGKDSTAVVLGGKATAAERAAADLLRRWVERRFGLSVPVLGEGDDLARYATIVLLGQAATHARLQGLLRERKLELPAGEDGGDGYLIECVADGRQTVIVAAGSNGRGVTYAADTLFQLVKREGERVVLVRASIRDWASIPWRGRPMTDVTHYLEPGTWDGLVSARMNWIDLRNGTYAFEPEYVFTEQDRKDIAAVIAEAHQREILVYGAVNCGVSAGVYPAVMEKFRQFIAWGVDGLWISFDDKGPGDHPEQITYDVLSLGLEHGISGSRIATTPPKGSYQTVDVPFNRKIMRVPGMERALWFWTPLPSEGLLADARAIGMRSKASWWHNWPRVSGGFTHLRGGNLNTDLKRTYVEIPALEVGWHEPSYAMLADAVRYVQAVVPWSGNTIAKEYVAPAFGWWAWSPEQHDWQAVRSRIYDTVYGPGQVATMLELEETLLQAKSLFAYAQSPGPWRPNCPARLKRVEDRARAGELLDRCERMAAQVAEGFAAGTLLDAERVRSDFVAPLQQEIRIGKRCAAVDYPEYGWDAQQREILTAVHAGDLQRADALIAEVRPRLSASVDQVARELGTLSLTARYVEFWKGVASMSAADWQRTLQQRQAELPRRVWHYSYYSVVISDLLPNLLSPPLMRGRGGTARQMRVLASALPEVKEQYWGDYLCGLYEDGERKAAVFAMEPGAAGRAGDYAELPVNLPVSGNRERLGLLVFMNRWTKDKIGNEEVPGRWAGYSSVQLLWGDKVVWEADAGLPRTGHEWDLVSLPPVPADVTSLELRLRVIDKRDSNGMHAIVFVGPIRLVELPD